MSKAKIAIIEDDVAISQMYRMKFEMLDYKIETAENGKLGLDLVKQFDPDIVLLDLMMPEMNGADMLEAMRATEWGKDKKVIILTNMGKQEAPPKINELGVTSFIVKAEMTPKQVAAFVEEELAN